MNRSQNIITSSTNQQINSGNIEENATYIICPKTSRTNRALLQHLNFCRRRNITSNGSLTIATTNYDNNDNTSNSNNSNGNDIPDKIESQEKFYWNLVAGSTFEKKVHKKRLYTGRRTCLCYQVEQLIKGLSKKSHVS